MSIQNFIPTVWSEVLHKELSKKYVAVANCNRDYEGEIKEFGSQVRICGLEPVSVFQYVKNQDMPAPELLSDTATDLIINRATAFNFIVDDVDRVQANPGLMNLAMRSAADALANDADSYVFSLFDSIPTVVTETAANYQNILDTILDAREMLYSGNITDASEIVLEVSPIIASMILKAKMTYGGSEVNQEAMSNGYIGSVFGCKVFVSKNIHTDMSLQKCIMRTKRAITFADQFTEVCAYRPENRFADAVKGLHLYGAKIVHPDEIVALHLVFD